MSVMQRDMAAPGVVALVLDGRLCIDVDRPIFPWTLDALGDMISPVASCQFQYQLLQFLGGPAQRGYR